MSNQYIIFTIEGQQYGLNIDSVQEITVMAPITPVPKSEHYIEGITNLRGLIIPIVNLRKKLNIKTTLNSDAQQRIVVVNVDNKRIGLIVDEASQVKTITEDETEPVPKFAIRKDFTYIDKIGKINGGIIPLIHLSSLLNGDTEMSQYSLYAS